MDRRQTLLANVGLIGSIPAAILPWVLHAYLAPIHASAEAELPTLTAFWMDYWPVSVLLPVLVAFVWWRLRGHPLRGTITAAVSAIGAMLVDGLGVIAVWLAVLHLPALV